jgi:carbonic anhydrase/acetyltransferase-like protein (isoleucine patch superfamily)
MVRVFQGRNPEIHESAFVSQAALITGRVKIGENCTIWDCAVLRGDVDEIVIGKNSNVQDGSVLHVDIEKPLIIGNDVTIGHGVKLHGCTIGDGSLIGIGAIVLNGAHIGENCMVGAGALVTPNKKIEDGSLVLGSPAKVVRQLTDEEIQKNRNNSTMYVQLGKEYLKGE